MFLVGVSLNPKELKGLGHAAVLTSHVGIVTPFCLGSAVALFLYPRLSSPAVGFTAFALFMGSAMSITAFPVLARILGERKLLHTRIGTFSIACAAADDITGWCILAFIVALTRARRPSMPIWATVGGTVVYIVILVFGVKPLLPSFEASFLRHGRLTENAISLMIVLALAAACATEWLGIHLVFGAFLMGAIMPKSPEFTRSILDKMESVTVVALLPLFFAFSGLRTNILAVRGGLWMYALAVVAVAIAGKLGGSMFAARMAGIPWREAASLA